MWMHGAEPGRSTLIGLVGVALHDVQVVARRRARRATAAITRAVVSAASALRHDAVHRLGSDVLRRLVLGLLRCEPVRRRRDPGVARRGDRRRMAAGGHRRLRSLASAAHQHADPADLGHDGDLGASRAPEQRPQGPEMGPRPHHRARRCCSPPSRPTNMPTPPSPSIATMAATIYGSTFFMATGFHGFHVIIGTIFLIVCLFRAIAGHFTPGAAFRLRGGRLVLALRRRRLAVPLRLHLCVGFGRRAVRRALSAAIRSPAKGGWGTGGTL